MRSLILAVIAGLGVAIIAAPAVAQDGAGPTQLSDVRVIEPAQPDLPYRVAATLRDLDGSPLGGVVVRFYVETSFLGGRAAYLGDDDTNQSGMASVAIEPRARTLTVTARFEGDDMHAPSQVTDEVTFPDDAVIASVEHTTHSLLAPVRELMPRVISALVAGLWLFLIGMTFRTVRTIRRAEDQAPSPVPERHGVPTSLEEGEQ